MSIFLTGSTGFVGNGILHYLEYKLYQGTIYLLIRDKKEFLAIDRFNKIKSEFKKLNLEIVKCGLDEIQHLKLNYKIDYIINCAASIEFDLELKEAICQNVDGLRNLIEFGKKNVIKKFIHISTAYVSDPSEELIKEEFINLDKLGDITKLYEQIKSNNITFDEIKKKKFFPNTYTFTKCLAEKFIQKEIEHNLFHNLTNLNQIQYNIIRPSIVTSAIQIPFNGWFKGYAAALGYYALLQTQMVNYIICDQKTQINCVPIDYVCAIIYDEINEQNLLNNKYIKHATSPFENFDIKTEMYLLSLYYDINVYITNAKSFYTTYLKYKILIILLFKILFCWILSFIYPLANKNLKKLQTLYKIIANLDSTFNHFRTNTYNFDKSNVGINYEFPSYCKSMNEYFIQMQNSIRSNLNISNSILDIGYVGIIKNIWSKYTASFELCYMSILSVIVKFFISSYYKNISIEFNNIATIQKLLNQFKPTIIVANHQSHFDSFILKYLFLVHPSLKILNPYIIATDEFKSLPFSKLIDLTKIKYISRTNFDKDDFKNFVSNLKSTDNILFFPEGSRSRDKTIQNFKSGIFKILNENLDYNILPISIAYSKFPESDLFKKSILNDTKLDFYDIRTLVKNMFSFIFTKPKENCYIMIDKLVNSTVGINKISTIINYNHNTLLNKHYSTLNINSTNDSLINYFFNNIQYIRYAENPYKLIDLHKYLLKTDINFDLNHLNKNIQIDYKKIFYPIEHDLYILHNMNNHFDKTDLMLGKYSMNLYDNIIKDNRIDLIRKPFTDNQCSEHKFVLITGGTGLIGTNLIDKLIKNTKSSKYIILSRNIKTNKIIKIDNNEFHLMYGDLSDYTSILDYDLKLFQLDRIYHLGDIVSHSNDSKEINIMNDTNMNGIHNINKYMKFNKDCHLIYLSTSGCVVDDKTDMVNFDSNTYIQTYIQTYSKEMNQFPYYKSKIDAEKFIIEMAITNKYKIDIFRPSMIKGDLKSTILDNFELSDLISKQKIDIFKKIESGKLYICTESYVNAIMVDELIDCMIKVTELKNSNMINIYNLTGHDYKLSDIFKHYNKKYLYIHVYLRNIIIFVLGFFKSKSLYNYAKMSKYRWGLNITKAKNELNFNPKNILEANMVGN
jgi:1-acyl-sn-glycerol-3-phosphate acyltransferase